MNKVKIAAVFSAVASVVLIISVLLYVFYFKNDTRPIPRLSKKQTETSLGSRENAPNSSVSPKDSCDQEDRKPKNSVDTKDPKDTKEDISQTNNTTLELQVPNKSSVEIETKTNEVVNQVEVNEVPGDVEKPSATSGWPLITPSSISAPILIPAAGVNVQKDGTPAKSEPSILPATQNPPKEPFAAPGASPNNSVATEDDVANKVNSQVTKKPNKEKVELEAVSEGSARILKKTSEDKLKQETKPDINAHISKKTSEDKSEPEAKTENNAHISKKTSEHKLEPEAKPEDKAHISKKTREVKLKPEAKQELNAHISKMTSGDKLKLDNKPEDNAHISTKTSEEGKTENVKIKVSAEKEVMIEVSGDISTENLDSKASPTSKDMENKGSIKSSVEKSPEKEAIKSIADSSPKVSQTLLDSLAQLHKDGCISVTAPSNVSEITFELFENVVNELKARDDLENFEKLIRNFISAGFGEYAEKAGNVHLEVPVLKFFKEAPKLIKDTSREAVDEFDCKSKLLKSKSEYEFFNVFADGFTRFRSLVDSKLSETYLDTAARAFVGFLYNHFAIKGEDTLVLQALDTIGNEVGKGEEDAIVTIINQAWVNVIIYAKDLSIFQRLVSRKNKLILEASYAPSFFCRDSDSELYFEMLRKFDPATTMKLLDSENFPELIDNLQDFQCDATKFSAEDVANYFLAIKGILGNSFRCLKYLEGFFRNSSDLKSSIEFMKAVLCKSLKKCPGCKQDLSVIDITTSIAEYYRKNKDTAKAEEYLEYSYRLEVILGFGLDDDPSNADVFDSFIAMRKKTDVSTLSSLLKTLYTKSPALLSCFEVFQRSLNLDEKMIERFLTAVPKTENDFEKISRTMIAWQSVGIKANGVWRFPMGAGAIDGDVLPLIFHDYELPVDFNYSESVKWKAFATAYKLFLVKKSNLDSGNEYMTTRFLPNIELVTHLAPFSEACQKYLGSRECRVVFQTYQELIDEIEREDHNQLLVDKMRNHANELLKYFQWSSKDD